MKTLADHLNDVEASVYCGEGIVLVQDAETDLLDLHQGPFYLWCCHNGVEAELVKGKWRVTASKQEDNTQHAADFNPETWEWNHVS